MRLRILSDLHIEVAPFEPDPIPADLVVLAGDIHNGELAPRWARAAFPDSEILMIPGNHEFYDGEYYATLERLQTAARKCSVHLLENAAQVIGGVRFLGCTLWTDFRLFERPGRPLNLSVEQAVEASRRMVPDFRAIRIMRDGLEQAFDWQDWIALHARSRRWLACELSKPWDGHTVVVSHHLPSWNSVHPDYAAWASNAAFATDLDPLIEHATLWIHGHTHTTQRYRVGSAEVVCNPRGYPRRAKRAADLPARQGPVEPLVFENPGFDPGLVIDLNAL